LRSLLLGYVYPAYACFKALERRKPDGIRAWCEYWCAA
jgi:receptor expression-enhancing protein 1/2/3/4